MYPWFQFNGIDSRDMGLWVSMLPSIQRPKERTATVDVYGRAGSLTLIEGRDIYEEYDKTCSVLVISEADFLRLHQWLRGSGEVIFSNEPDRIYSCRISSEVDFKKLSNDLKQADITFTVYPFKRSTIPPAEIAITGPTTIKNPGDIVSRPVVTITGTGNMILTVNGGELTVVGDAEETGAYILDSATEFCTNQGGENLSARVTGDYPVLVPGENAVSFSGEGVTSVKIKPVWWYL